MANTPIVDADEFSDAATMGEDEVVNATTWLQSLQPLANRTRYLLNRIGGVPTLAANTVLGRASTGPTEGKSASDYGLSLLSLSTVRTWFDSLHSTSAPDIAAAATVNLAAHVGHLARITGTGTTVTSFGSAGIGAKRTAYFEQDGVVLANSASLQLPGGQDFESLAGDSLEVVSLGSSVWKVMALHRYDGVPPQTVAMVDNSEYAGDQMILELSDTASNKLLTDADTILLTGEPAATFYIIGADLKYARVRRKTLVHANPEGTEVVVHIEYNADEPIAEYKFAKATGTTDIHLDPGDSVDVAWDPTANRVRVLGVNSDTGGPQ